MDQQEIELNYNEKILFEDLENKQTIITDPWQINKAYKKEIEKNIKYFKTECSAINVSYHLLLTSQMLDSALYEFLNKRIKFI